MERRRLDVLEKAFIIREEDEEVGVGDHDLEREVSKRPKWHVCVDARQMGRGMTIVLGLSVRACDGATTR